MTRIVKTAPERRAELIACAQRLFFTKGYDSTSVNDIIAELGIAKGTFYHYFDSKLAILEALVDDLSAQAIAVLQKITADDSLPATAQWVQAFQSVGNWKYARKADLLAVARLMDKPENVRLRLQIETTGMQLLAPELAKIITRGVAQGLFTTSFGEEAAGIVIAIMQSFGDALTDILLHPEKYTDPAARAGVKIAVTQAAIELILGAPPGSLPLVTPEAIAAWFAPDRENLSAQEFNHEHY